MNENGNKPHSPEDDIYEIPITAEDLKREVSQGAVTLISGFLWLLITGLVFAGLWYLGGQGLLINQGSTEKSYILTALILLPLIGVFFNMIAPHEGKVFLRINALVYTLIPLLLVGVMYFGYNKARTEDGRVIYLDQLGQKHTINTEGIKEPIDSSAQLYKEDAQHNFTLQVNGHPEIVQSTLVKNYFFDRSKTGMQFEEASDVDQSHGSARRRRRGRAYSGQVSIPSWNRRNQLPADNFNSSFKHTCGDCLVWDVEAA